MKKPPQNQFGAVSSHDSTGSNRCGCRWFHIYGVAKTKDRKENKRQEYQAERKTGSFAEGS